ncbi:hypothetical protein M422DRAFT_53500 [Sphaerobolus stellatus SS14]|uniref:Myb/SANT-like domain-containing protein n=1 Tax=Sphaerobolus stellatus (strain SS14) TaxID=990650 RepID=A0A0C9V0F8_SPHS4|nr:hypothetical protein M422DRAFT_53500 [Sphaerobolus stellatus SS14]
MLTDETPNDTGETCIWTAAREATLVSCLLKAKRDGNQAESGFKAIVWTIASATIKASNTGIKSITQCKSPWQWMKGEYRIVFTLRQQSGFGWNEVKQLVVASKYVWDKYIKTHPKASPFRKKVFPLYSDVTTLVDAVIATRGGAIHLNSGLGTKPSAYIHSPAYAASVMLPAPQNTAPAVPPATPPTVPSTITSTPATSIYNSCHNTSSSSIVQPVDKEEEEEEEERDNTLKGWPQQDPSNPNKHSRKSGSEALYSLASAMDTLAASIAPPQSTLLMTLEQCTKAIQIAEEEEEGYSDHEYANISQVLSKGNNSVTYLAFKWPGARSAWLRVELHRQQLEE